MQYKIVCTCFRAGTRNEPAGKEGIIHLLRMTSSLSTKQSTQFSLTRVINQAGASLTCTSGREHVLYSMDASRKQMQVPVKVYWKFM
jgi:ubiquinol-cytochrome c reductase core subunit 2